MKLSCYLLIGVLLIAVHHTTEFPTEHQSPCCSQCVVCETSCKRVKCDEVPCCSGPEKHEMEINCPDGFTFNGTVCMQDYSSKINVQPLCCCECRKC